MKAELTENPWVFLVIKHFPECSVIFYASIIMWNVDVLVHSCCESIGDAQGLGILTCTSGRSKSRLPYSFGEP